METNTAGMNTSFLDQQQQQQQQQQLLQQPSSFGGGGVTDTNTNTITNANGVVNYYSNNNTINNNGVLSNANTTTNSMQYSTNGNSTTDASIVDYGMNTVSMDNSNYNNSTDFQFAQQQQQQQQRPMLGINDSSSTNGSTDENNINFNNTNNTTSSNLDNNSTFKFVILVIVSILYIVGGTIGQVSIHATLLLTNDYFIIITQLIGGIGLSCIGEYYYNNHTNVYTTLQTYCLYNITNTFQSIIPAVCDHLYIVLIYLALPKLSIGVYEFTHEDKLIITAIMSCILLKNRKYNIRQWIFLFLFSICIAYVQHIHNKYSFLQHIFSNHTTYFTGIVLVLLSSIVQAFGCVYFEKLAKADIEFYQLQQQLQQNQSSDTTTTNYNISSQLSPPSFWIRNIQVTIYSVLIKIILLIISGKHKSRIPSYIIQDNTSLVYRIFIFIIMFCLVSCFSILYVTVIRYVDNVQYGITVGCTISIIYFISMILSQSVYTISFIIQLLIAISCVFVCTYYFNYPLPNNFIYWLHSIVPTTVSPYVLLLNGTTNTGTDNNNNNNSSRNRIQHRYESLLGTNNNNTNSLSLFNNDNDNNNSNNTTNTNSNNLSYAAEPFLPR